MIEIKIYVPSYFKKFRCIAGECPDTCCIGWEVDIDPETADRYSVIDGMLGNKIKKHLTRDETGCDIFTLCASNRCPFLNSNNLCEIQLNVGEDALSKTCTLFPRFFDDFGQIREMGLGFGCPEAARIILEDNNAFTLNYYDKCSDTSEEIDEIFLTELIELRKAMFSILEDGNYDFREKVTEILNLAKEFQMLIDGELFEDNNQHRTFQDCIAILENMEFINVERKAFVIGIKTQELTEDVFKLYRSDFEKLMIYYIFRYLLKAVYDYDVLTKVKYGIFACIVISRIYSVIENIDFDTRVKVMYSYSKEVEYSDLNMELLDEMLYENFGTNDLMNLI